MATVRTAVMVALSSSHIAARPITGASSRPPTRGRRGGNSGCPERTMECAILGPIVYEFFPRVIGLIAIPAVLVNRGVKGVSAFLQLVFELRQPVELLLLLGGDFGAGLRVGPRALRPQARRARKEERTSQCHDPSP